MRLKIVHVIESASGGSFRYVMQVCRALDPAKWEITVVFSRRSDTPDDVQALFPDTVTLIEIEMTREISPRQDLRASAALRSLFKRLKPDLIHLHSSKAGVVGRLAAWNLGVPVLYTPHGFSFFRQDASAGKRLLYRLIEKGSALLLPGVFVVGSKEEQRAAASLASARRVRLVLNAVEVPPAPLPLDGCPVQVATVGRITAAKDPGLFLQVAHATQRLLPDVQFVWVGDGELREELEAQADKLGVALEVTGWISPEEVRDRLGKSLVYLQTSSWEGLPFSLLEAMSMARPVVASDIVAHRDVLTHGRDGLLAATPDAFARAIAGLIEQREQADVMGRAAWETVREAYSDRAFQKRIETICQNMIGKGNRG